MISSLLWPFAILKVEKQPHKGNDGWENGIPKHGPQIHGWGGLLNNDDNDPLATAIVPTTT